MADPMRVRATEIVGVTEVKILMKHNMDTDQRKDAAGKPLPAHYIQTVVARHKDREVFSAQFGQAISKDPFLSFKFKGAVKGDKVSVSWVDNTGDKRTDEATIA